MQGGEKVRHHPYLCRAWCLQFAPCRVAWPAWPAGHVLDNLQGCKTRPHLLQVEAEAHLAQMLQGKACAKARSIDAVMQCRCRQLLLVAELQHSLHQGGLQPASAPQAQPYNSDTCKASKPVRQPDLGDTALLPRDSNVLHKSSRPGPVQTGENRQQKAAHSHPAGLPFAAKPTGRGQNLTPYELQLLLHPQRLHAHQTSLKSGAAILTLCSQAQHYAQVFNSWLRLVLEEEEQGLAGSRPQVHANRCQVAGEHSTC